jgi:hypothetical protein
VNTSTSPRERELIKAMRDHGYACEPVTYGPHQYAWKVSALPIQGYTPAPNPHVYRSVQGCADSLCPILRDSAFTRLAARV